MAESCLLYYITDRRAFSGDEVSRGRRLLEKVVEAAGAGVDYIQLREKDLPARDLEFLAREAAGIIARLRAEKRKLRPALLINSRTDVAIAAQADGVHLRTGDIMPLEVREVWGKWGAGAPARVSPRAPLIAVSCHTIKEVMEAEAGDATFAVFAPVFEKEDSHPAGLNLLHEACQYRIPVLALGGVTLSNAKSCLEAGAAGIAAIRLFQENDIKEVVRQLRYP